MRFIDEFVRLSNKIPVQPKEIFRKCNVERGLVELKELIINGEAITVYSKTICGVVTEIVHKEFDEKGNKEYSKTEFFREGKVFNVQEVFVESTENQIINRVRNSITGEETITLHQKFDEKGRMVYEKDDEENHEITITYHEVNDKLLVTGQSISDDKLFVIDREIRYNQSGLPYYVKDSDGTETWWCYTPIDERTHLVFEKDSNGWEREFKVDPKNCLCKDLTGDKLLEPIPGSITYIRDIYGRVSRYKDGLIRSYVDSVNSYFYEYDSEGRKIKTTGQVNGTEPFDIESYEYDSVGRLVKSVTGGTKRKQTIEFTEDGNTLTRKRIVITQDEQMDVYESVFKFDRNGNVIHQKDKDGYEAWNCYKY